MNIFKNSASLRGFLAGDAEVPTSDHIQHDSYAVLTLSIESGVWNKARNKWIPQTAQHTVICPGPYFCGFTRGMKQGDYIEVEGELRSSEFDAEVGNGKQKSTIKRRNWEVRASIVKKLARPQHSDTDTESISEEDAA